VQINQRDTDAMIHANQKNTGATINLSELEIDLEFSSAESKNGSKSETESEIENIFNSNSNAEKSNKKLYLILRLYAAIFILKKYLRGSFRIDSRSNFIDIEKERLHYIKD
jgi:hypothetical protein